MRIGVDASNIRAGGTVTHLIEVLRAADPVAHGIQEVVVWSSSSTLCQIEDRPWLRKVSDPMLEQGADPFGDRRQAHRAWWQRFRLPRLAHEMGCALLFVPGGMDNSGFRPMVSMSQNMLPFEPDEARRYGVSTARLRLWLLRRLQTRTFARAEGIICLTEYARDLIVRAARIDASRVAVVPHGISEKFFAPPRQQKDISCYSDAEPFKLVYVSSVDLYKHQWHVAMAVARMRTNGLPLTLELVGAIANHRAMSHLQDALRGIRNAASFISYRGPVPYVEVPGIYRRADLKIFASSCENMPNILVEAMAAGLPIACSDRGPMPQVLEDAGVYFDPENPTAIAEAATRLIASSELRADKAARAFQRAQVFSWERCAARTFAYLAERGKGMRVI